MWLWRKSMRNIPGSLVRYPMVGHINNKDIAFSMFVWWQPQMLTRGVAVAHTLKFSISLGVKGHPLVVMGRALVIKSRRVRFHIILCRNWGGIILAHIFKGNASVSLYSGRWNIKNRMRMGMNARCECSHTLICVWSTNCLWRVGVGALAS